MSAFIKLIENCIDNKVTPLRTIEEAEKEFRGMQTALVDVRYCPECQNIVTKCDTRSTVYYCGMCNKNLFESELDDFKGQMKNAAQSQ